MGKSKREKAFELFDQGLGPNSDEVAALKLKGGSRRNYYSRWLNKGSGGGDNQPAGTAGGEKPTMTKDKKEEGVVGMAIDETKIKPEPEQKQEQTEKDKWFEEGSKELEKQDESEGEAEGEPEKESEERTPTIDETSSGDGKGEKTLPDILSSMSSEGIVIRIIVSIKTLTLYEIARASSLARLGKDLSMGGFVDIVAEDYYDGRGYELGLITKKEEEKVNA